MTQSMKRRTLTALMCLILAPPVLAKDKALSRALSVIPKDAIGFVLVPSIERLDGDFQRTIADLQLAQMPFLQPPMNSLAGLMGQYLSMTKGLDPTGPMAIVMMPFDAGFEAQSKQVVIVPADDPKALLESMNGSAGEGDTWSVMIFGQPVRAAVGEKRVIFAQTDEIAKQAAACKDPMSKRLHGPEADALSDLDLALWIDTKWLVDKFRPQIDAGLQMFAAMQGAGGPLAAKQGEAGKKQIEMLVEGLSTSTIGVSLGQAGLGLRFHFTMNEDSELAKISAAKMTTKSLLKGLPAGDYMLAAGQLLPAENVDQAMENLAIYFDMLKEVPGADAQQVDGIQSMVGDIARLCRSFRMSVESSKPGPDGLFGVNALVDTTDSEKWMTLAGKLIDAALGFKTDDEDFKKFVGYVKHEKNVNVGGASVEQVKFDVVKIAQEEGDAEEEDLETVKKIIGEHGLVVHLCAVNKKTVAICLGSDNHMARLVESARKGKAALDKDAGIVKVNKILRKKKSSATYVAVDNVFDFISKVAEAAGEEALPVAFPKIDAPLSVVGSGGKNWARVDLFVPTELMQAGKNVGMMLMGTQGGGSGGEPPTS